MSAALRAGLPQREILAVARARREAIARRERPIIGTSTFPLLDEAPVKVLVPSPAMTDEGAGGHDFPPLRPQRDAEPFERLRASADAHYRKTGERPKIFLAAVGPPQAANPVAEEAERFFRIAGISSVRGEAFASGPEAAARFSASGCKIACLCAPPDVPPQKIREMAQALEAGGAARVFLAGREPGDANAALPPEGVSGLIWARCNALELLKEAMASALPHQ